VLVVTLPMLGLPGATQVGKTTLLNVFEQHLSWWTP
jgi:hypothetical protein